MAEFNTLVERYLAVWNEGDEQARAAAVAAVWTEDATYTDPMAEVSGHAGIAAVIGGVQGMFPGYVFQVHGAVDGHHNVVRFGWELVPAAGGGSVVIGFDVAVLAEDGRIRAVHGFLDKVPAAV